jgi:predicted alpha/beta-hydrolase family hydrolase
MAVEAAIGPCGNDNEARPMSTRPVRIEVDKTQTMSAILLTPENPFACCVLAHGAGAGMTHPFMTAVASGLFARGVSTLRYQFPYMENGSKRPDRPALAHAAVRAAVVAAGRLVPDLPLLAGGKSFGARMTSQAQAEASLPGVAGLAFLGFPLHPAGKPSTERATHLMQVTSPMFFAQGMRDALADPPLLRNVLEQLPNATSYLIEHADHSFHVPARSGTTDQQVLDNLLDALTNWAQGICRTRRR